MGESQPTLEMGPCLARHPQFGAYFRNCFKNLLLEHRVWRIEHCYTILRGVTSAVGVQFALLEAFHLTDPRQGDCPDVFEYHFHRI